MKFACKSVVGGWQTVVTFPDAPDSEFLVGPVFNKTTDLWAWQAANLRERAEGQPMPIDLQVRIMVGAEAAYACIRTGIRTLDVRLRGGCGAVKDLRRIADEMREKAVRELERADLVELAAVQLELEALERAQSVK